MVSTSSRRVFLTGAASLTTCVALGSTASAQSAPNSGGDGFRILRATSAISFPEGGQSATPAWGYDGTVPGPLLRIKQGEELKIRLINELPEETAIHWHGIRVPNSMDGTPSLTQSLVETNKSFDYRFKVPDAGTFWYYATATLPEQRERGLYGVLIVEETLPPDVDHEAVILLDDRILPVGNISVKANERLRLRLINASKARVLHLRVDRHAIRVMAIDGQPAEPFLAMNSRVTLGPGNRIDLFLDALLDPGETAAILVADLGGEKEIGHLGYDGGEKRRAAPLSDPRQLPANGLPERIDLRSALRIDAVLDGAATGVWSAPSGAGSLFGRPLFSVKRGRAVVMAFPNKTDAAYALHLHGHHVRLLDNLDDGWKPFWLDTILAPPKATARVAFVADNPGKWLIECQLIGQPKTTSMAWFEVA